MKIQNLRKTDTVKGGEVVSRMLAASGVTDVFGIIDGTYFGMYSTFGQNGIRLVTPRHETSAVHMAGAYARATGKLGVCMASNGPGVANALPGVAVEQAEGNRVLLITSSRRGPIIYPDRGGSYQYFPHTDVIRPMAKWSCAVPAADRIAEILRKALRACFTGRPGVVHIDIPESLMNGSFPLGAAGIWAEGGEGALPAIVPSPAQVAEAARILAAAKRPLLHAGSGVVHAGAYAELQELAELLSAPITTSWGARAALDERTPQAVPMLYVDAVNKARREADVALVLGSRLGETDWWGKPPYWAAPAQQKLIQVDVDPEAIGRNRPVDLPIQADVKATLQALITELRSARLGKRLSQKAFCRDLRDACAERRKKLDEHLKKDTLPMHPAHVPVKCQQVLPDDAILVVDGGNTSIWTHFFTELRTPGAVLGTPKMGMLGAGVAQALGAKAAFPNRVVYCIIGDGAMGFHPQEIETAVRADLPVIYIVLCDKQWGMVKINQQFALKPIKTLIKKTLSPEETINTDLGEIEFDELARAMGAYGERVADAAGFSNALRRAVASGRPSVIHVDVDPVAHMWAPNLKTFKDMHGEPGA